MPKAVPNIPKGAAEHAFAGSSVPFSQLYQVDHASGLLTYRTRCGLYVPAACLVRPGRSKRPVPCAGCQAAREETL